MKVNSLLFPFGVRNLEENHKNKERQILQNNLTLHNITKEENKEFHNVDSIRVVCDKDTFEEIIKDTEYIEKNAIYWQNLTEINEATHLRFSNYFSSFELTKKINEEKYKIIYKHVKNDEDFKHCIHFTGKNFVKMTLKYVDRELSKLTLFDDKGKKMKIKLRKTEKNKNKYFVNFNFLNRVDLLLPIFKETKIVGFIVKYGKGQISSDSSMEMMEQENDIIIPDYHAQLLQKIKDLEIRLDLSYFMKGNNYQNKYLKQSDIT